METIFHVCESVAHVLVGLSHEANLTQAQKETLIQVVACLRLAVKEEKDHRRGAKASDVIHSDLRELIARIVADDGATIGERPGSWTRQPPAGGGPPG